MGYQPITCFTERALLNSTVLDWICPPNCEKNKITQTGTSALGTLENSKEDIYSNKIKTSVLHWGAKPLRAVARVTYIGLVTITASPLGALYYGTITGKNLIEYSYRKYVQGDKNQDAQWEKIKHYAQPFFKDLACFVAGAAVVGLISLMGWHMYVVSKALINGTPIYLYLQGQLTPVTTVAEKVFLLAVEALIAAGAANYLGAYYPSYYISRLLGNENSKTGMYLSLEMRNQLGLVDGEGNLLKFSQADKIECDVTYSGQNRSFNFKGHADTNMTSLTLNAEFELLDLVREAKQWMVDHKQPAIAYKFPINGYTLAKSLEKTLSQKSSSQELVVGTKQSDNSRIHEIIKDLRKIQYKVDVFHDLHKTGRLVAAQDPLLIELLSIVGGQPTSFNMNMPASYIQESLYKAFFDAPFGVGGGQRNATTGTLEDFLKGLKIPAANPDTLAKPTDEKDLYAWFLYRIQVKKWNVANNKPSAEPFELLGLKKGYSDANKKDAIRKLNMALHPDKNKDREEEAKELFQVLDLIKEKMGLK